MRIKKFFQKIQWFFSFKKRRQFKAWKKKASECVNQFFIQHSDELFSENSLDFNAPTEIIEVKSNDFFVCAGGGV